nr:callose synthase 10 [Ipomoea batatas]
MSIFSVIYHFLFLRRKLPTTIMEKLHIQSGGIMMTSMNTFGLNLLRSSTDTFDLLLQFHSQWLLLCRSPACFEWSWPFKEGSSFLLWPRKGKRTGKSTFVEHRTFLHLYRSFHRLWIFLVVMFQALTIVAFSDQKINLNSFKTLLSVGPTFAIMNFIESCLDVLLMFGAYSTARGMAISRLVIRFFWTGFGSAFVTYVYLKLLEERNRNNSDSLYFRIYVLALGVYAGIRIVFALLTKFPATHTLSEMSDQSFFQFFKWIYQVAFFIMQR